MKPETTDENEALLPQSYDPQKKMRLRQKVKNNFKGRTIIDIDMIVNYCLKCVTWDEAKPVVGMLEKLYGMNAPPDVDEAIAKIKRHFSKKIYGWKRYHIKNAEIKVESPGNYIAKQITTK